MTPITELTVVELPEPEPQSLVLVPRSTAATKGSRPPKLEPLEDRLAVGVVAQAVKLGTGGLPDPKGLLQSDVEGFRFFLAQLTVTTLAASEEPFVEVQVDVRLDGGDGSSEPIAWSMAPDRLEDKIQLSREISIDATLKLVALGAVEVGPGAGWKRGMSVEKKEPFLLAAHELTSRPLWKLRRTSATEIDGMTRLSLMVRAPEQSTPTGQVRLSARVERQRLGIFPYDAQLPDGDPVPFALA